MATGSGLGRDGNVLLLVALAPRLICRLIKLLIGGLQFCLTLAVSPTVKVDLAGEALGLEKRRLLCHVHVWRDCPVSLELLLSLPVLLKEMEVVGRIAFASCNCSSRSSRTMSM
ncbi:hypothetical protein D1007_30258 [Hordeum vulgare]|nr:hypothetical protein D1007_30258 [Hordeum vulgare]